MGIKTEYQIAGYLVNYYGERISNDFVEHTRATSWEEAERYVAFNVKTKKLGLAKNAYVKLKQTKEQEDNSWRRSV